MATNFLEAHRRHHADAEHLHQAQRYPNADHLFGFSAECGLKALMVAFGMGVSDAGDPSDRRDKKHIDHLSLRYATYQQRFDAARFVLANPAAFSGWKVGDRYAEDAYVSEPRLAVHRQGAEDIRAMVRRAELEGILQ